MRLTASLLGAALSLCSIAAVSAQTTYIWPDSWAHPESRRNSSPKLYQEHANITKLRPRWLVLNFDNFFTAAEITTKVTRYRDIYSQSSRYHLYKGSADPVNTDPNNPNEPELDPVIHKVVQLADNADAGAQDLSATNIVGTVSIAHNSDQLIGVGTKFHKAFVPGEMLTVGGFYFYVKSIESATALTLVERYPNLAADVSGGTCGRVNNPPRNSLLMPTFLNPNNGLITFNHAALFEDDGPNSQYHLSAYAALTDENGNPITIKQAFELGVIHEIIIFAGVNYQPDGPTVPGGLPIRQRLQYRLGGIPYEFPESVEVKQVYSNANVPIPGAFHRNAGNGVFSRPGDVGGDNPPWFDVSYAINFYSPDASVEAAMHNYIHRWERTAQPTPDLSPVSGVPVIPALYANLRRYIGFDLHRRYGLSRNGGLEDVPSLYDAAVFDRNSPYITYATNLSVTPGTTTATIPVNTFDGAGNLINTEYHVIQNYDAAANCHFSPASACNYDVYPGTLNPTAFGSMPINTGVVAMTSASTFGRPRVGIETLEPFTCSVLGNQPYDVPNPVGLTTFGTDSQGNFFNTSVRKTRQEDIQGGRYFVWWYQNLPARRAGALNTDGTPMLSWWPYLYY